MNMIQDFNRLLEINDFSKTDLSKKVGIDRTTLSKYLNGGRSISDDTAYQILVKGFGYDNQKALEQIARWRMEEYAGSAGIDLPEGAIPMADNYTYIPLLAEVSCGEGMDMDAVIANGEHEALVPVPNEYIKDDKKTFAFTAKGSSMSTEIQDGDTVVIQHTKEYAPGKVHLYKLGEDFGLARLQKEADGTVTIKKANPQYPPVQVGSRDIEVCGVVQVVLNLRVY